MKWLSQIEHHAQHRPAALAVTDGAVHLSYGELFRRARGLAARLHAAGAGAESLVALALPQSAARLAAALGVLLAGAAYLPLGDRETPARLAAVLLDAEPDIVVAPPDSAGLLAEGAWQTWTVAGLEGLPEPGSRATPPSPDHGGRAIDNQPPWGPRQATDLAYVIYTSGSTGAPKGVEIEHGSLARLIAWHLETYAVTAADRASLLAYPGFDAAVWELWPYWAAGASVHIPPAEVRLDAVALRDWLLRQNITLAFAPTPLAEQLMVLPWPARPPLRALLTGGDQLRRRPAGELPFPVFNHYGPTEAAVVTTHGRVLPAAEALPDAGLPDIGRPVPHARIKICQGPGERAAAGEAGEICIAGSGLARGYRHDPGLTAQRFSPELSGEGRGPSLGERWYHTGDRGQWTPGGELQFLGRLDRQIKIRGWRIEPAEIERHLLAHPAVRAAAVTAHGAAVAAAAEAATGAAALDGGVPEPRLVAYLVARGGERPGLAVMRAFLRDRLPEAMLPAEVRWLAGLPETPQGKWDRAALAAAEVLAAEGGEDGGVSGGHVAAPADGPTARALAAILAEALGVARVGADEDFFLLGGHSLLGVQLVARVREELGVALPLRCVFDFPTANQLGMEIDRRRAEEAGH